VKLASHQQLVLKFIKLLALGPLLASCAFSWRSSLVKRQLCHLPQESLAKHTMGEINITSNSTIYISLVLLGYLNVRSYDEV
jgi:hypothetical protein